MSFKLHSFFRATTVLLFCLAATLTTAIAQTKEKPWPPISPEEMALKDCPQQPGAAAVCLYYEETTSLDSFITTVFKRVKILTPAGRDYANIEIPYRKGYETVKNFEARVVPPEGAPKKFTGPVLEKTAFSHRGFRVAIKTIAFPDVSPGCIIDYRHELVPDIGGSSGGGGEEFLAEALSSRGKPEEGGMPEYGKILSFQVAHWDIQNKLLIRKARFEYTGSPFISFLFSRPHKLTWISHGLGNASPVIQGGNRVELEIENVPGFEPEEWMPPEGTQKMSVDIFYIDSTVSDINKYWKQESQIWQKSAERFIGDPRKSVAEVQKIVGDVADPTTKLQKIYERAQNIRNLSYEKTITRRQRKAQKIKENSNVTEVLARSYGVRSDITRTFVALARAAGFEADLVRISTRDDKLFRPNLPFFYLQFDSEAALVKLGDKNMLFDPATPFCPFGLVHWNRSNTAAVVFSDNPPAFFTTSNFPPEMALTQREVALHLDNQGDLSGTVKVTYQGQEALVRRLDHIHDDETEVRKSFENELSGILPIGARVALKQLEDIDKNSPHVVALYDVTIPGIVTEAGDRVLIPASPLLGSGQHPFRHAQRRYPVYFRYPFREFDDIVITLPDDLAVMTLPEPRKSQTDFASYSLASAVESPNRLHVQRDLVIKKSYFPVEQYAPLKAFYDLVRTSDEEQVILVQNKKPSAQSMPISARSISTTLSIGSPARIWAQF